MARLGNNHADIPAFQKCLNAWYAAHGRRDLPWRKTRDPYAIYLSEIMLQQTQVKTVLERFYFQFLKRFPTLAKLAAANEEQVLQAWQGLGYYSRARNLHMAAKNAVHGLPETADELILLPGIGRNTAYAVAAFAFHQPVAVMEANVRRVLCRIFAIERPTETELWEKAQLLLDKKNVFDYNQAMMDVGSMLCKKRTPLCSECPAAIICKGKQNPKLYPTPKSKKQVPVRKKNIVVLQNSAGEYYASPRSTLFLKGLYHFIESDAGIHPIALGKYSYNINDATHLGAVRQQYSHFTLEAEIYIIQVGGRRGAHWHSYHDLLALPVSMAEKKILLLLEYLPAAAYIR